VQKQCIPLAPEEPAGPGGPRNNQFLHQALVWITWSGKSCRSSRALYARTSTMHK